MNDIKHMKTPVLLIIKKGIKAMLRYHFSLVRFTKYTEDLQSEVILWGDILSFINRVPVNERAEYCHLYREKWSIFTKFLFASPFWLRNPTSMFLSPKYT